MGPGFSPSSCFLRITTSGNRIRSSGCSWPSGRFGGRKRFGWAEFLGMGCGLAKTNGFRFCKMILCEVLANVLHIISYINPYQFIC